MKIHRCRATSDTKPSSDCQFIFTHRGLGETAGHTSVGGHQVNVANTEIGCFIKMELLDSSGTDLGNFSSYTEVTGRAVISTGYSPGVVPNDGSTGPSGFCATTAAASDAQVRMPIAHPSVAPVISRAAHTATGLVLEWDKPSDSRGFTLYHASESGVTTASTAIALATLADAACADDDTCTHTIPYDSDFTASGTYHFAVRANGTDGNVSPLSAEISAAPTPSDDMMTGDGDGNNGNNAGGGGNTNPQPAADSGGSSGGGAIAAIAIGAGAYFWWKKRQIANGNAAKMALLPDVNFDLDRNDRRAFFTRMNWANSGNSNWQLRGNAQIHTKYSGKLLDWNADSHLGYRLNGKLGEFNPYLRGKFVQNAPENAKMEKTYTVGVNYAIPNRFSVQFLQPDDEIWRYSIKTQVQLGQKIGLNFARPNSDLPDFSLGLRYQNPRGFSVSVTQPNSEIHDYSLGIQWRGGSRIRYEFSGNTSGRALKLRGSISF